MTRTVKQLAASLNRPVSKLLTQLRSAGVQALGPLDLVSDVEALRLRNHLRALRGQEPVAATSIRISQISPAAEVGERTALKNKLSAAFNEFLRSPTPRTVGFGGRDGT
jgi:hypothetical protein